MSKSLHFIIQATAAELAAVWPLAPRWTNSHTDPQHFVHIRLSNYSVEQGWHAICNDLGAYISEDYPEENDIDWSRKWEAGDVRGYAIWLFSEDEANDWIQEAMDYFRETEIE